jgi:DNA-binding GntR family transcriptional regulator
MSSPAARSGAGTATGSSGASRFEAFDGAYSLPPGRALDICLRLQTAIIEHRLQPGIKLSEDEVGEIYGASRTVVRSALQALAHSGLVEIKRNRGATVAKPTVGDAHEVFEARALIEPEVARRAAAQMSDEDLKNLREHIEAEHEALAANDMGKALALSGLFHIAIADIAEHSVYAGMVQSLITKSSLIIALYWNRPDTTCESHAHHALMDAFAKRDGEAAHAIMRSHLIDLHSGLDLKTRVKVETSLAEALAGG